MPTLQPWQLVTKPPAQRFVAERNPYFHRVDSNGQQLPYIDQFILEVVDGKLIPIKTGAGEIDLQARRLVFKDYTFLKESEARSGLTTLLWPEARSAHLALYPNLNAEDPIWRGLFRDLRFRKALALAIDRDAIGQFLYAGLAVPANNTILPESPLWLDELGTECVAYEPDTANKLCWTSSGSTSATTTACGCCRTAGRWSWWSRTRARTTSSRDVLELLADQWAAIGFKITSKPSDRQIMRSRVYAGNALMSMFFGIDNGVPAASLPPTDFAPTSQGDQLQWPQWGQHYETKGEAGEPPDLPEAKRLMDLYTDWTTASEERQTEIWHEMLKIYASQCYTIGLVSGVLQPVAARSTLRNLPKEAIFNWEPHGQFGIYLPDTFWYARVTRRRYSIGAVLRMVIEMSPSGLRPRILPSAVRSSGEAALGALAHPVPLGAVALLPQPPVAAVAEAAGDLDRAVLAERLLGRARRSAAPPARSCRRARA